MAHQTEAACLLESGALYGKRLLLRPEAGDPVFAGLKPGAFSLYFGDAPIFHFDREGRWQRAYFEETHYLKGLDSTVQTIERVREGENLVLKRKALGFAEASDFDARVRATALDLIASLDAGRLEPVAPTNKARPLGPEELRAILERVAGWDAGAWFAHREAYLATYGPLPFLSPDCTSPVVLQATLGHEGGLTFGGAPPAEYAARTPAEFVEHARDVARLLGRRVEQCKAVFLGGSDVLRRPVADVAAYLEAAASVFPIEPAEGPRHPDPSGDTPHRLGGVHAFLDRFTPPLPDRDAWRRLRALGLVGVSLGVESGDPAVRALYGKDWTGEALAALVADLKAAEIGVGVIALVGAGGADGSDRHLDATAELINTLELGPGDIVSLIDAVEISGPDPVGCPEPLTGAALAAQRDALKARLAPVRTVRRAKVVAYSLAKQGVA
jgi:hypothetical protein